MQTPRTDRIGRKGRFSRPIALLRGGSRSPARAAVAPDRRLVTLTRPSPTAAQLVRAGLLLAAGLVVFAVGFRGGSARAQEIEGPAFAQLVNPDR